jgi:hypothetical protein
MTRTITLAVTASLFFFACTSQKKPLVDPVIADSLITHYQLPATAVATDSNLNFWQRRMNQLPDDFVNGPKYASVLLSSFRLYGNIHHLLRADSLIKRSNDVSRQNEPEILRSLASLSLARHRFAEAGSFLQKSLAIEGRSLSNHFLEFDIAFERGDYSRAKKLLQSPGTERNYAYLFRRSKMEHYDGSLDSAISCMLQASEKAGNNTYLEVTALSNAADLYMHNSEPGKAAVLYRQCININAADFHSIAGLGWIALVCDKKDSLAERIFQFVQAHTQSPDALLKLVQVAEERKDTTAQKKYAEQFVQQAGGDVYGLMYSKYLIDLYTGILQQPAKAVEIAEKEIVNRPNPQVYAWYAWSLYCNGEKERAYNNFKSFVSKKPLEGMELYYMGCMMKELGKEYNAQQFFKAAWKNKYDLSPSKIAFLKEEL